MKKILCLFIIILLCIIELDNKNIFKNRSDVCIYTLANSNADIIYEETYSCFDLIFAKGQSVQLNDRIEVEKYIKNLKCKLIYYEKIDDIDNFYYYSKLIKQSVVINSKKINFHVSFCGDKVIMGTPIIFGCY